MALTVGSLKFDTFGITNIVKGTIDFDSSYPTGGESLVPANIGLSVIDSIRIDDKSGYTFEYDYTNQKVLAYRSAGFTPAGTNAACAGTNGAPAFTGSALAAHRHTLHFETSVVANAVTAAANNLRTAAAAFDVAGVANSSGEGGVVDVTGGTPAGTVAAPTFTGSASAFTGTAVAAAALIQVANATDLSTLTGVRFRAEGA